MNARLCLLVWALLANIAVEVQAQGTLADFGGNAYAMGYYSGWRYGMGYGDRDFNSRNGNDVAPGYLNANQKSAYKTGYHAGLDAGRSTRSGWAGLFGGFGAGGYGMGMNPLAAAGQYNLDTAKAAVNYQQAYQESIQNQKLRTQTYFDDRQMNASYHAQQQMLHQHASAEELSAFSRARLPAQLSADEFNPAKGVIQWPGVLNRPEFEESRAKLAELFSQAAADPHGSGPGTRNYREIEHAVDDMSEKLHSEIAQFKPAEYIAGSKFLKSLVYHHAHTPPANALAKNNEALDWGIAGGRRVTDDH